MQVRVALPAHAARTSFLCLTQTQNVCGTEYILYFTSPCPLSLLLEPITMSAYLNQCRGWLTDIFLDLILICGTGQGEAEPSTNPASAATDVSCRCTI
ncbi:hypothetical protein FVEG_07340 [Fusarium verticillioides 7600]|uniref:Uncharacterized protein n=1 Tax=Gibberella moniliformis (strain M3125 / FGSC 7600) TaxID=334819 RepID=W7MR80_GIBM7|nr:hypothetical protein FVEG_07340 [Fusarium verticillioides 7600]EWG47127.1 hypothetical protein FVEG_07340 [Fusarium verticillioides 7600]